MTSLVRTAPERISRRLLLCAVLAAAWACASCAGALGAQARVPPALSAAQQRFLGRAEQGVARAQGRWRDRRRGWYDARLGDSDRYPLATIWDIVPLFQSLDAIAIASPTAAHGWCSTRCPPWRGSNRRWLNDAERALAYIARAGWDPATGGIWWNTSHPYKSGPALASDALLATLLYQLRRSSFDLAQARRFLGWANTSGFSQADGLYAGSSLNATPVDYIEAPLIYAQATLCRITAVAAECQLAERLKARALSRFGYLLDFSPQYDAIYLQWMLALYALDGDRTIYAMAADNARDAQTRAANGQGLYLLSWNGQTLPYANARPGMLQTQAATTSLFAWLAVYPPPS